MNPQSITSVVTVNGQSEVRPSCPSLAGLVDLSAQAASISSTNLVGLTAGRLYRITGFLATTSGQAGLGNVLVTIGFTAPNGATTVDLPSQLSLTAGNTGPSSPILVKTTLGSAITYATTYNATGKYDLVLMAEMVMP